MRLTEILKPANIRVPIAATQKADAIRELVDVLAANGDLLDPRKVLDSVMERELTRTTGIGYGLAIPHGKTNGTDHLVMALGKCEKPIEFQALDGKPVTLIWLLVSPLDKAGQHITTLAKISRLLMIDRFRADLNRAPTAEAMYDVIASQEVDV